MNKSELIERLSQKCELGHLQAEDIVNLIFDKMKAYLAAGNRIEIRGFGSFMVKTYEGYMGRNPKTGEQKWVAPKKMSAFKLGKELRERLNAE